MIGADVMIDLETMGTGPDAAIVAIGAVEMDFQHSKIGRTLYQTIELQDAIRYGGVMEPATIMWWMRQSDQARAALMVNPMPVYPALRELGDWMGHLSDYRQLRVWGNGSDSDNVILARAYQRSNMLLPWTYPNNRCYRTLMALYPDIQAERAGVAHNALDDAMSQARHLVQIMRHAHESGRPAPTGSLSAGQTA